MSDCIQVMGGMSNYRCERDLDFGIDGFDNELNQARHGLGRRKKC